MEATPHENCLYRIALSFRGSKFLRIAIFEDFVEISSQIRCKFLLKYFHKQLKIHEIRKIKDLRKISA